MASPQAGTARADITGDEVTLTLEPGADELLADTRFEIGSIVKTMTATLLATYVVDGTVALADDIGNWVDAGPNGAITLGELATHTSGLPRLPPRLFLSRKFELSNPYAHLTIDALFGALRRAGRKHVGRFEYSNFGYMLLAEVLAAVGDAPFDALLRERVLIPAGLESVTFAGDDGLIPGYRKGKPAPHWDNEAAGAGGIRASVVDLARWVTVNINPSRTALADACALTQAVHATAPERAIGLGWLHGAGRPNIRWHNGGTGGFSAFCGFDVAASRGVVVLTNDGDQSGRIDNDGAAALA